MPRPFIGIVLIALVVTIDNALLAGLLLPSHVTERQKKWLLWIVGGLLGASQVLLAASVDKLLDHIIFRIAAICLLGWMCIRTLTVTASA